MDLTGLAVTLTINGPAGSLCDPANRQPACSNITATTYTTYGHYQLSNLAVFDYKGVYTIQARFGGTGLHSASDSSIESLLVGTSAGHGDRAGKVSNNGGLESTQDREPDYEALKERGS
jgi:hypothetical protein